MGSGLIFLVAGRKNQARPHFRALVLVLCALGGCDDAPPGGARAPAPGPGTISSVWLDEHGRLTANARAGLGLLAAARSEGLDPSQYEANALSAMAARFDAPDASAPDAALVSDFDARLSAAVVRYYHDVHIGRVDPRALGLQFAPPADEHDFAGLLRQALDRGRVAETAADLAPPLHQYQALKSALATYRSLAARASTPLDVPVPVRPGDPLPTADALRARLALLGDLSIGAAPAAAGVYDDGLASGVRRFQERHGLAPDGVIGRATAEALRVPVSWRVRQIEFALERLRWLPDIGGGRLVGVNIPMFHLWAWDEVPSAAPALSMPVIVGRALDTRTPVFAELMRHVVFRPYWNVPTSILRGEILPALRKEPDHLARNQYELVRGQTDAAPAVEPTPAALAELAAGTLRLRQRPGPANALGLIKFVFPNRNDVYMHATPAPQLFARSRRDFSHGCIRVADPVLLAEWVLKDDPAWTRPRIVDAMNGAPNARVDLATPIQVVIFYTTAVVLPGGAVHFAADLYGHDAPLDRVLRDR
jgi:murein L,D-transpeptidase YcbB/YkuD